MLCMHASMNDFILLTQTLYQDQDNTIIRHRSVEEISGLLVTIIQRGVGKNT